MFRYAHAIFVLLTITTKVCAASGKSLPSGNKAHAKAQDTQQQSNNSVTSYFQHDPYGPNTYAFGYEVNDKRTGNIQFRDERRFMNGSVEGSYGYVRPDGRITVTHFMADKQRGYLSQTQTFDKGEEHKWQQHWPTQKPDILLDKPAALGVPMNVTYDKEQHLNLTLDKIPDSVANAVKEQHGLDLNSVVDLEDHLISPIVEDVITGEIPLKEQKTKGKKGNSTLGFETVEAYIPPDFAIVPFELPTKLEHELEVQQHQNESKLMETTTEKLSKYDKAKVNNAEKAVHHMEHLIKEGHATELIHEDVKKLPPPPSPQQQHNLSGTIKSVSMVAAAVTPKPLTDSDESDDSEMPWYEKVIADNRKDFLENIPNLA